MSRLSWDENDNHLHISPHSSNHAPTLDWVIGESSGASPQAITSQSYSGPLEMQLMTCPDDCAVGACNEAPLVSSITQSELVRDSMSVVICVSDSHFRPKKDEK